MKIAVTGSSGFIGRNLVRNLIAMGHKPVLLLKSTSVVPDAFHCLPRVDFEIGLKSQEVFERSGRPEILIHLAWEGLPNFNSMHHLSRQLPRHMELLESMVAAGLPKLVVTGTCFEYGLQYGPLGEHHAAQPYTAYGCAKFNLLTGLLRLGRSHSFELTWVRPFFLYGTRQPRSSLYPQLCWAIQNGDSHFPMSGGEQLRDFMPIERFSEELTQLALKEKGYGIVNICDGKPVSVRTLVERWIKEKDSCIQPDYGKLPYPDYEPLAFWGIREKLDSILSY